MKWAMFVENGMGYEEQLVFGPTMNVLMPINRTSRPSTEDTGGKVGSGGAARVGCGIYACIHDWLGQFPIRGSPFHCVVDLFVRRFMGERGETHRPPPAAHVPRRRPSRKAAVRIVAWRRGFVYLAASRSEEVFRALACTSGPPSYIAWFAASPPTL